MFLEVNCITFNVHVPTLLVTYRRSYNWIFKDFQAQKYKTFKYNTYYCELRNTNFVGIYIPSIVVPNVKNVSTVNFFKANKIWLSRAYFKMCVECKLVKCICMFIQVAFVCLSVGYFGVHVATSPGAWWRTRRHYPEPAPVQLNMV